jgi:hypothetical protein
MGELFVRLNFPPMKAALSVIRTIFFRLVIREKALSYAQYLV